MQLKSWVSRHLSFADEAIQVVIDDTDSLETLKARTLQALRFSDYRASQQRRRLFEDTDLTQELTYEELRAARHMAELMYPLETLPAEHDLGGKTTFEFSKNLPGGEVLKIYVHEFETYEDVTSAIKAVWELIDTRLVYTNKREQKAQEYFKGLPIQIRTKVLRIMEILYGRSFKETVIEELQKAKLQQVTEEIRSNAP